MNLICYYFYSGSDNRAKRSGLIQTRRQDRPQVPHHNTLSPQAAEPSSNPPEAVEIEHSLVQRERDHQEHRIGYFVGCGRSGAKWRPAGQFGRFITHIGQLRTDNTEPKVRDRDKAG